MLSHQAFMNSMITGIVLGAIFILVCVNAAHETTQQGNKVTWPRFFWLIGIGATAWLWLPWLIWLLCLLPWHYAGFVMAPHQGPNDTETTYDPNGAPMTPGVER